MEIPKELIISLIWVDINSGSSIPIENSHDRKEAYVDEFCWTEDIPRYLSYDERILKLLFLN